MKIRCCLSSTLVEYIQGYVSKLSPQTVYQGFIIQRLTVLRALHGHVYPNKKLVAANKSSDIIDDRTGAINRYCSFSLAIQTTLTGIMLLTRKNHWHLIPNFSVLFQY